MPNAWLYRSADFECGSHEEAQVAARKILPPTGELLEVLDVDALTAAAAARPADSGPPLPRFTGRWRRVEEPRVRPVAEPARTDEDARRSPG